MLGELKTELENLKTNSAYRQIKTIPQGCLNLSSNDYLGIAADTRLREFFFKTYGGANKSISNPSARLLSNHKAFDSLERTLEKKLEMERALCFNSGFHANLGIYSTFAKAGDVVFCDRLNHASIIDGIKLGGAKLLPYKHLDYEDLRVKLKKYRKNYKKAIICSETLFSMDGDFANLSELVELKREFNCLLFIDEAHTFGVYGKGAGLVKQHELNKDVDLVMGTFGKAIGSYGAFCAGSELLINYLTNFARPFIFSTTFPPISAAFAQFVLEQKQELATRSKKLLELSKNVRKELNLEGESYIIPVILGANELASKTSEKLIENGYYALPIRYPTVAKNCARIRLSLNADMEPKDLCRAISLLNLASKEYKERASQAG